jgi:hypothetical protein
LFYDPRDNLNFFFKPLNCNSHYIRHLREASLVIILTDHFEPPFLPQSKALSRSQLILRDREGVKMFRESIFEASVRRLALGDAATEVGSGGRKD